MGRKPTGRPPGRQPGSGTLGLGSEDAHQRLTIRIPQALYTSLQAFAKGRHYTRGTAQLAGCVREAVEHLLTCPNKRQTVNGTPAPEDTHRQTVNSTEDSTEEREDIIRQTVNETTALEHTHRQTVNVPEAPVSVPAEAHGASVPDIPPFDTSKYRLGKLCTKNPETHVHGSTGQSLRRLADSHCVTCDQVKTQRIVETRRQAKAHA